VQRINSTIFILILILSAAFASAQENSKKPFILGEIIEIRSAE